MDTIRAGLGLRDHQLSFQKTMLCISQLLQGCHFSRDRGQASGTLSSLGTLCVTHSVGPALCHPCTQTPIDVSLALPDS